MARKRHTADEIANSDTQATAKLSKRPSVATVCKLLGVTERTDCRWRIGVQRPPGIPQKVMVPPRGGVHPVHGNGCSPHSGYY